jgi:hypothetical protein
MTQASPDNPNLCPACDGITLNSSPELAPELIVESAQPELAFSSEDRKHWRPRPNAAVSAGPAVWPEGRGVGPVRRALQPVQHAVQPLEVD